MDRRLFLTGLLGAAGAAAMVAALPRQAEALAIGPLDDTTPDIGVNPEAAIEEAVGPEGVETAWHNGRPHGSYRRRRRRVRRRRFRRTCRRYRNRWGAWATRCYRRPYWAWIWI
jgi:hypothetical protein